MILTPALCVSTNLDFVFNFFSGKIFLPIICLLFCFRLTCHILESLFIAVRLVLMLLEVFDLLVDFVFLHTLTSYFLLCFFLFC